MFEETEEVSRQLYSSCIYFDIVAVLIWIASVNVNYHWRASLFMAIGFIVYYLVDAVFWMEILKIRIIDSSINPWLLQIWLQLGPGVIHPSWVCLMIEGTFGTKEMREKINRTFWTFFFFMVQFCPAFFQLSYHTDDLITVSRTMSSQRGFFILFGCLGYMYLCYQRVSLRDILKLLAIGTTAEGFFEFSLYLSGIRQQSLRTVLFDSLIEFNVGMPYIVIIWILMIKRDQRNDLNFESGAFTQPICSFISKNKLL
ncbi:hypothetical protein WA158_005421 [Blastocystis sp. Blastoise]